MATASSGGGDLAPSGAAEVRRVSPGEQRDLVRGAHAGDVELSILVTLRGGELSGTITGSVPYGPPGAGGPGGGRTAHTSIPLPNGHETELRELLEAILRDCADDVARAARIGAAQAILVAANRREAL